MIPGLEDEAVNIEGGENMNLRVVKQRGDGGVQAVLLTQSPGQVEEQLPSHHLVTVDTANILHLTPG